MRILMTTRGSAGHVLPLAPFGHACVRAGHEVRVAAQQQHAANVRRTGLPFVGVDDPPAQRWLPLLEAFAREGVDAANRRMIGEYFAAIDTTAALPAMSAIVAAWRPDVIVRESWEFASTLVAEANGIPIARVGLGLSAIEALTIELAAPALDEARAAMGLPADPLGERLRETPYFTQIPQALDDPAAPTAPLTQRFRSAAPRAAPPLADWWPRNDDPLVYVTLGSVTPAAHLPFFPALYRAAIDALADLPVRILLTVGDGRDPGELGALPAKVHVERWVAQDVVAPHAALIVGHGGYGTTLGALAHGVPLVVLPLFSIDQWANAQAVARAGAGVQLAADRATRRVLALPDDATLAGLRPAVERVLAEPSFAQRAEQIADEMRALPVVDTAATFLAEIRRRGAQPAAA